MALGTLLLLGAAPHPAVAHDIPPRVTVQAIVRPSGDRLRLLVRVPLASMRDVVFPLRDGRHLDVAATTPLLPALARTWIAGYVRLWEHEVPLDAGRVAAARLALPTDPSFATWEAAMAPLLGPALPDTTALIPGQALLDVLLEYPIRDERARFSIEPEWAHLGLRTSTVLRFVRHDGAERVFRYDGNPGRVRLDPRWFQAAATFTRLGVRHILDGLDHLLFVFCLVLPFRRIRPLVLLVTAFTAAHSVTLIAATSGLAPDALWFPPLIETLIAASIVFMALENILGAKVERRWLVAFAFGLAHGFGFSFALRESLQFSGANLATALVAFNAGVEIGQLLVLAIAVPLLGALFRRGVPERAGTIVLSALVAHTAWHWMTERLGVLRQYRFTWPTPDLALLAALLRWLMLLLIVVAVGWGISIWLVRGSGALARGGAEGAGGHGGR